MRDMGRRKDAFLHLLILVFCLRQGPASVRVPQTWRKQQGLLTEAAGPGVGLAYNASTQEAYKVQRRWGRDRGRQREREETRDGRRRRRREGREESKEERGEGRKKISGDLGVFMVAEKSRKMSPK